MSDIENAKSRGFTSEYGGGGNRTRGLSDFSVPSEQGLLNLRRLIVVGTTAVALSLPQGAEAHRLPRPMPLEEMTTRSKAKHLRRQVWHDRSALRFWRKRRALAVERPNAQDAHWHRVSLGIALRNLRPLERALARARLLNLPVPAIIRYVFGPYGSQAVAVSYCETGGTFSTSAANGMYLGIFQMGSWERATYGHGSDALTQARAAYRYFVASGRDWFPWACRP